MNINNIRYGDDTVLTADMEEKLQRLVDQLDEECRGVGLKININKTEVLGVTKRKEQLRINVNEGGQANYSGLTKAISHTKMITDRHVLY